MLDRIDAQRVQLMNAPDPETQGTEWLNVTSNNHGFFSKHDYPYRAKNRNDFLLGVFGGSVAQWFCLQQGQCFARDLAGRLSGTRRVELLNFGLGAFKQPQVMHAFAHFLMLGQQLDAVLLLDGFNEAALSWLNASRGLACAFPSISYIDMFRDVPCVYESEMQGELPVADRVNEIASLWQEGARVMREICQKRAIPFFHVLQPNQYYSKKRFTAEETGVAISATTPYREGVRLVFPRLVERMGNMRQAGWNAFDATGIFDDRLETTYSDNCCHYNRLGNAILQEFILTCMVDSGIGLALDRRGSSDLRAGGIRGWFAARKARRAGSTVRAGESAPSHKDDLYPMW